MVNNYGIQRETYIPSVFGENRLQFSKKDNFLAVDSPEFYNKLIENINGGLMSKNDDKNLLARSVLVFFENEGEIDKFRKSAEM